MNSTNTKPNSFTQRGFTIVELLIVVVVIAILAAITIVSYNGITTRANASAAKSLANTWQKKIELYHAEEGRYPVSAGNMDTVGTNESYYIDNSSTMYANDLDSENGKSRVHLQVCGTEVAPTGVRINYYDYNESETTSLDVGTCGSTFGEFAGQRTS